MKKGIIIGIVLLLVVSIWAISSYIPGEGDRAEVSDITGKVFSNLEGELIEVNKNNGQFEFEGFAVGKNHIGTFDEWEGYLIMDGDSIIGAQGIIKTSSVNTGIEGLDNHLRSDDFFDVVKYPEIIFTTTTIGREEITGQLNFRGVSKEITFPAMINEDSISVEFFLDVTPFNFKYIGINKEVRIAFEFNK
tara:strand:+ start:3260 stop:3832 length:573 start_codon:yes stop_codon:yes gene_type:complete